MNDIEAFASLVQALAPWRQNLIFIGGWGHRLHRLDPRANRLDYQAVFTRDTDLAFANKEPIDGDIKKALTQHGFNENLSGEFNPPTAHYILGDQAAGFYAEFLTPLAGSGYTRKGTPDATMLKAGISAQKIRHLDILLVDPWVITLGPDNGIPLPDRMDVQVVNPLSFIPDGHPNSPTCGHPKFPHPDRGMTVTGRTLLSPPHTRGNWIERLETTSTNDDSDPVAGRQESARD